MIPRAAVGCNLNLVGYDVAYWPIPLKKAAVATQVDQ